MQTSPLTQFIVATANTHWGQVFRVKGGLSSIADADILLLQEVINIREDGIEEKLRQAGFNLVHSADRFGLAIALRQGSTLAVEPTSLKEHQLQMMSSVERRLTQRGARQTHTFTEHGMIAAKFLNKDKQSVTVVNIHLTVPLKPRARRAQVVAFGKELAHSYYDGFLVVGGDMNHYRGPTAADKAMWVETKLQPVDLNNEPTWYARGSSQEKYLKVGAFLRGRSIEYYNGYHDTILYRGKGIQVLLVRVVDIPSDHRAIIAQFKV